MVDLDASSSVSLLKVCVVEQIGTGVRKWKEWQRFCNLVDLGNWIVRVRGMARLS
jgi:hypothetical protein